MAEARAAMPAVVFDVGNVLIRWEPRLVWDDDFACAAEMDRFMAEIGFDAWNLEQDRGRSWAEGVAAAAAAHPHRRTLFEKFHRDWHRAVPGAIDGTIEILERLHAAGVPLYAITNFSAEKWAECLKRFPFLAGRFDDCVVSAHERLVKPDPAIFELFLARNGWRRGTASSSTTVHATWRWRRSWALTPSCSTRRRASQASCARGG